MGKKVDWLHDAVRSGCDYAGWCLDLEASRCHAWDAYILFGLTSGDAATLAQVALADTLRFRFCHHGRGYLTC
jgi:hypothetical protein